MRDILVIDDEKSIVLIIAAALTKSGFNVEKATNGLEGIKKFDEGYFDLVITDLRMPGLDGNGVVRHIRNSERQSTPVVSISATPWHLQSDDFDAFILKPFSIKTLIDTVNELTAISLNAVVN